MIPPKDGKLPLICFATNNPHKIEEINQLLEGSYQVVGLEAIGCHEELAETQSTIEGNSRQKAAYVWENYGVDCFADDTGLEVIALNGEPGVYSARYAGPQRDSQDNMRLLLERLAGKTDRRAQFRTVVTLVLKGEFHQFEGVVAGQIRQAPSGEKGFGYDPVFEPTGHSVTFAEMSLQEKNKISHRGHAIRKLTEYLRGEG